MGLHYDRDRFTSSPQLSNVCRRGQRHMRLFNLFPARIPAAGRCWQVLSLGSEVDGPANIDSGTYGQSLCSLDHLRLGHRPRTRRLQVQVPSSGALE